MLHRTSIWIFFISLCLFISCTDAEREKARQQLSKNSLQNESSPYLLQHAKNPVNWQSWNNDVIELAQEYDKPLIISIGYSACHWCHVMEEESFEDKGVARFMNEHFINIKVDREERPDVDRIYLKALEAATGNGGWPLNVIALPDGRPVWIGTYLSKTEWMETLKSTLTIMRETPEKAEAFAQNYENGVKKAQPLVDLKGKARFRKDEVQSAVNRWRSYLDFQNGGLMQQEKFPLPASQQYLLRYAYQNDDEELINYINTTLFKMAHGGIFDPVTGGFSRYSIDSLWHVPHFEKMLYDNAQLMSLYSDAYKATKDPVYKEIIEKTADFIHQELTYEKGLYSSSLDADSTTKSGKKEEGAYYTWTPEELEELLITDFEFFKVLYNINEIGFWERDQYILIQTEADAVLADRFDLSLEELMIKKEKVLSKLKTERALRDKPKIDDKVLTSWNALTAIGFLDAYEATAQEHYLKKAIDVAEAISKKLQDSDLRLKHSYKNNKSSINAHLMDYATFINAYIKLYENTGNTDYLNNALGLLEVTLKDFENNESPLFYYTSAQDKSLIVRDTEVVDGVLPSSNAMMAENLYLLSHYLGRPMYAQRAEKMLQVLKEDIVNSGAGYGKWLQLMNNYSSPFYEIAVVGNNAEKLVRELQQNYLPNALVAQSNIPSNDYLLANRYVENKTLIYVCRDNTCKLPVTSVKEAMELMRSQ